MIILLDRFNMFLRSLEDSLGGGVSDLGLDFDLEPAVESWRLFGEKDLPLSREWDLDLGDGETSFISSSTSVRFSSSILC